MPLNASEKTDAATAMLKCFREDHTTMGRTLKYLSQFTAGQVSIINEVKTLATTWPPFIESGLSIEQWKSELQRYYDSTIVE
jgi:hypothetical protein